MELRRLSRKGSYGGGPPGFATRPAIPQPGMEATLRTAFGRLCSTSVQLHTRGLRSSFRFSGRLRQPVPADTTASLTQPPSCRRGRHRRRSGARSAHARRRGDARRAEEDSCAQTQDLPGQRREARRARMLSLARPTSLVPRPKRTRIGGGRADGRAHEAGRAAEAGEAVRGGEGSR